MSRPATGGPWGFPMSHEFTTIRISQQGKEQMIKLKRATGIKNWNTLCRWALCLSIADCTPPLPREQAESNVEMSWRTFAGQDSVAYAAIIVTRARRDGTNPDEVLSAHVHRGLGILAGLIGRDDAIEHLHAVVLEG